MQQLKRPILIFIYLAVVRLPRHANKGKESALAQV